MLVARKSTKVEEPKDKSPEDMMAQILSDGRQILQEFPSHAFSMAVQPCKNNCFAIELPTTALWEQTLGRLRCGGRWAFEDRGEVVQRTGRPLDKLIQPLAKLVAAERHCINFPMVLDEEICGYRDCNIAKKRTGSSALTNVTSVDSTTAGNTPVSDSPSFNALRSLLVPASSSGSTLFGDIAEEIDTEDDVLKPCRKWYPDNVSTRVCGTYHETLAVQFPACNGVGGDSELTGGDTPCFGSFVGTCSLHADDEVSKACLLTTCIVQVYGAGDEDVGGSPTFVMGRHGRADTALKAKQLFRLVELAVSSLGQNAVLMDRQRPRVRICSLLNALVIDQKELGFFQKQLAMLTEDQGRGNSFSFKAAMTDLKCDYSCLNFVANWPLSLRLGNGPPSGKHNVTHPRGFLRHLSWLVQDTLDALSALPEDLQSLEIQGHVTKLKEICAKDDAGVTARWDDLATIEQAVLAFKVPAASAGTEACATCNRLFMAVTLLDRLNKSVGTNFRHRAAELLQLCVLEHILGVIPFFACKSGIDRSGVCAALWTTFQQLIVRGQPAVWLWHFLALTYPAVIKVVHKLHHHGDLDDKGLPFIPMRELKEGVNIDGLKSLLPFRPDAASPDFDKYVAAEGLCGLLEAAVDGQGAASTSSKAPERRRFSSSQSTSFGNETKTGRCAYSLLERLFFAGPDALVPQLQAGFFSNVFGVATKIAVASTGLHGLKYGGTSKRLCNALAAQFMPREIHCAETGEHIPITGLTTCYMSTEVAFVNEVHQYLVGCSSGRGT